ncbi:carboxylesterase/lipase family protein [Janthinobacterium sp. Mn2066]|uniref:carboxylesterase/lipase family protein n=1 Tax=Janthinobacterium sp. Mn2066 TaxID=3395264 RepID=UPI003BCA4613
MLTNELTLPDGPLRGLVRDQAGVLAYLGIPYAAPPVGELRWRPPQAVSPWQDRRDATHIGNPCFGSPMPMKILRQWTRHASEDCLTLNVWTQAESASERRPVIVWIHGGGFEFGAATFFGCEGNNLAAQGPVVVGMNYRLGVFGFLAHPELDEEGPASGNFGLQDMIKALQWVQQNIACFGGDPDKVTILGESAGAHAVGMLMASPLSHGLFQRAIGQSGAYWDCMFGAMNTKAEALARGQALPARLGVRTIAELRAIPGKRLNRATAWNFLLNPHNSAFSPHVDGHVLPCAPGTTFERGLQADVPLLAGWCRDEYAFFMTHAIPHRTPAAFKAAAAAWFGADRLMDFLAAYPAGTKAETRHSAELLVGDLAISQQTWTWLGAHRRTAGAKVFAYQYQHASNYSPRPVHGADLAFVFGTLDQSYTASKGPADEIDKSLSGLMMRYWANFAYSGDPNGPGLPIWPVYEGAGSHVMRFAANSAASPEDGTERFRFINSFRQDGLFPSNWRQVKPALPAWFAHWLAKLILKFY